jgi:hypothetical protein
LRRVTLVGCRPVKKTETGRKTINKVEYLTVPDVGLLLRALDSPSRPLKQSDD